jgi:hypothetical protein
VSRLWRQSSTTPHVRAPTPSLMSSVRLSSSSPSDPDLCCSAPLRSRLCSEQHQDHRQGGDCLAQHLLSRRTQPRTHLWRDSGEAGTLGRGEETVTHHSVSHSSLSVSLSLRKSTMPSMTCTRTSTALPSWTNGTLS